MSTNSVLKIPSYVLNNGIKIPALAWGTHNLKRTDIIVKSLQTAAETGFRFIDSAVTYRNEKELGKTVKALIEVTTLGLKREDFFLASKLPNTHQGYEPCLRQYSGSLDRWQFDYLDLFSIHWPGTHKMSLSDPMHAENRKGSWKALEDLYTEGNVRSIGISNYTYYHLTELLSYCNVIPQVLQLELHPLLYQKDIIDLCKKHKIQLHAYASVGDGKLVDGQLDIPIIKEIADKHEVTMAQVLFRWGYQHGAIITMKSLVADRLRSNTNAMFQFELTEQEMESLNSLTETHKQRFFWDPTDIV